MDDQRVVRRPSLGGVSLSLLNIILLLIFALASITDMLDGQIARKKNLITTFGKTALTIITTSVTTAKAIVSTGKTIFTATESVIPTVKTSIGAALKSVTIIESAIRATRALVKAEIITVTARFFPRFTHCVFLLFKRAF